LCNFFNPWIDRKCAWNARNGTRVLAGGAHNVASIFSPLVQYPINISKDLLLIYNSNSLASSNVCQYYLTNRPMVSAAIVLGIGGTTSEIYSASDFTNVFEAQVRGWLATNPTKRPQYVILFQDIPSRTQLPDYQSVQYELNTSFTATWHPFATSINMDGTGGVNDCIGYIKKLTNMANMYTPGQLFISASRGGYGNANWYFDWANSSGAPYQAYPAGAERGVTNVNSHAPVTASTYPAISGQATNVLGYYTCGFDCSYDTNMFIDASVQFFGQSQWYIMSTIDSFSGQRYQSQACFLTWFATNSFKGTNYSNTPVGAVTYVDEPYYPGSHVDPAVYYGDWAAGKSFAISAWAGASASVDVEGGRPSFVFQAVGDPFITK
jgi:hypothetical protein